MVNIHFKKSGCHLFYFCLLLAGPVQATPGVHPPPTEPGTNLCADSEFGVKFYCEPGWKWRRMENAILIILSSDPMVTLTISRLDSSIVYLEQLTNNELKKKGLYKDGFTTEKAVFAGRQALKVKAYSRKYVDVRLTDYFFIHHAALYGTFFSVYPKESWDKHKFVIQKVVDSFAFLN